MLDAPFVRDFEHGLGIGVVIDQVAADSLHALPAYQLAWRQGEMGLECRLQRPFGDADMRRDFTHRQIGTLQVFHQITICAAIPAGQAHADIVGASRAAPGLSRFGGDYGYRDTIGTDMPDRQQGVARIELRKFLDAPLHGVSMVSLIFGRLATRQASATSKRRLR